MKRKKSAIKLLVQYIKLCMQKCKRTQLYSENKTINSKMPTLTTITIIHLFLTYAQNIQITVCIAHMHENTVTTVHA